MTESRIALVTGASRGAGRGIAIGLGEKGMTVYVTGRTVEPGAARAWDGSVLPGTVTQTAAEVTKAGGKGIPVLCDHGDDAQVEALFGQIASEAGRILDVGLRSAYIASWHAARMMVPRGRGLIAFGSSFGATCYMHGPAYGAQKAGLDKFARDMAHDLRGTGVRAVSIWMGPLRTERAAVAAQTAKEQYEAFMETAENPQFTGHILHAIANDPHGDAQSGRVLIGAEIARHYGLTDQGRQPPSYRAMLGAPPEPNPAAVY